MSDTTPEITEKMSELIRRKSPTERLKMGSSMYDTSKRLVIRAILQEHPNLSKAALRQELFLKFYGADVDAITRERVMKHLGNG